MPTPPTFVPNTDTLQNERLEKEPAPLSSSIYVLHKDWSKALTRPNTVQEVIDGSETNTQYMTRVAVPPGATHMSLYWLLQYSAASGIGSVSVIQATITGATTLAFRIHGRVPIAQPPNSYEPADAGLSNAIKLSNTYGIWKPLFNIGLQCSQAADLFNIGLGGDVVALPYEVSSTRRFLVQPMNLGGVSAATNNLLKTDTVSSPYHTAKPPAANGSALASFFDANYAAIPVRGATEVILIPDYFGSEPSVAYTITGGTTTAVDFCGIGVSFHK